MAATANAKKTDPYRYIIVYLLEDVAEGSTFHKWSLHVTVLPWIALETDEDAFIKQFQDAFEPYQSFDTTVVQTAQFGSKKDVPVSLLDDADWQKLHQKALDFKTSIGARWAEARPFVDEQFKPHIAQRHGIVLKPGTKFHISAINLVRAKRKEDGVREVVAKAELS